MRLLPRRVPAAFTLVEILVSLSLFGVVGSIVYAVSTEALLSFARNVSINRSYTDARVSLDRLGAAVQCAGQTPQLVGADGKTTDAGGAAVVSPAPGVRFFRYGSSPNYGLPSGGPTLTATSLSLTATPDQVAPRVGDVVLIGGIGFQATVASVTGTSSPYGLTFKNADGSGVGNRVSSFCLPVNPTAANAATCGSALVFSQVAFIVVNRQLRYYPRAMTSADAGFNLPANYKVMATLPTNPTTLLTAASGLPVNPAAENSAQAGLPFSLGANATLLVTLCAEAPDYSQRNTFATNAASSGASVVNQGGNKTLGSYGSFTQMQVTYGPRCPGLLR